MSINPTNEVEYRYRLAVENFTKAVIAVFEVPTWSHDPSNQLNSLIKRFSDNMIEELKNLQQK